MNYIPKLIPRREMNLEKVLVLSDLHIGSQHLRDDAKDLILKLLGKYLLLDYHLVTLGDIFDITRNPRAFQTPFAKLFATYARRFVSWNAVLGNHEFPFDSSASRYYELGCNSVHFHFEFQSGLRKFLAMHGHQFDPNCRDDNLYYNRLITRAEFYFDSIFRTNIQAWLRKRGWIDRALKNIENDNYIIQHAAKLSDTDPSDTLLIGHRHKPFISPTLIDVGDMITHRSYLLIESGESDLRDENE